MFGPINIGIDKESFHGFSVCPVVKGNPRCSGIHGNLHKYLLNITYSLRAMLATSIQMHSSLVYRVRISASALNQGTSKGVPLTVYPWYLAGVLKGFLGIISHT